jgi:uncharacterized protein (DUF433 family)
MGGEQKATQKAHDNRSIAHYGRITGAGMKIEELIERDPEKMSDTPVFPGTRVPIQHLFDCLESDDSLDSFLDQFPTVSRDQALAVLSASRESLVSAPTDTQARLELMREAANDKLFLEDLNTTLEDFRYADQLEHPA